MFRSLLSVAMLSLALALPVSVHAGGADVVGVTVLHMKKSGPNIYRFRVTVRHADTGWDHYADRWQVLAPDGTVLGTRVLHHPHENEQPFTRYHDIEIPSGVREVTVRAGDKVHGFEGATMTARLPD
ncbi:MAG: hypothetical protein DHS20C03_19890 [Minwuia thermotolerans]|nr:MAG: hypothetical protein DHS20C03_19890 [Minwuia thermotolerans]